LNNNIIYQKPYGRTVTMNPSDTGKTLMIIGIILFMTPFIMIPLAIALGSGAFFCAVGSFVVAGVGMVFMIAGSFVSKGTNLFDSFSHQSRIPPVQYPRHPPRNYQIDSVKIFDCPNCGAPPKYVDANGLCMCEFCETKYKVR
jgi:hypothetical protein